MAQNITKCRLCLKLGYFFSIYSKDTNLQFAQMVMELTQLKISIDDGLPDNICSECIQKLSSAYLFKKQCERSDRYLRNHLKSKKTSSKSLTQNWSDKSTPKISKPNKSTVCDTGSISLPIKNNPKTEVAVDTEQPSEKRIKTDVSPTTDLNNGPSDVKETVNVNNNNTINDTNSFKCEKCNKTFRLNIMLKRHLQNCNEAPPVTNVEELSPQDLLFWNCDICDARFTTTVNLQKHIRLLHIGQEESIVEILSGMKNDVLCKYCHYRFADRMAYALHFNVCPSRQHSQTFMCPLCNRLINGRYIYLMHVRQFHFSANEDSTICHLCYKNLMTSDSLKRHLEIHRLGTVQYETIINMI